MQTATPEQIKKICEIIGASGFTFQSAQAIIESHRKIGFERLRRECLTQAEDCALREPPWPELGLLVRIAKMTGNQAMARTAIRAYTGPAFKRIKALLMLDGQLGLPGAREIVGACWLGDVHEQALALISIAEFSGDQQDLQAARRAAANAQNAEVWAAIASFSGCDGDFDQAIGIAKREGVAYRRLSWETDIARAYVAVGNYPVARNMARAIGKNRVQEEVDILIAIAEKTMGGSDIKDAQAVLAGEFGNQDQRGFEHCCRIVCLTKDVQALDNVCTKLEKLLRGDPANRPLNGLYRAVYQVAVAEAITKVFSL